MEDRLTNKLLQILYDQATKDNVKRHLKSILAPMVQDIIDSCLLSLYVAIAILITIVVMQTYIMRRLTTISNTIVRLG